MPPQSRQTPTIARGMFRGSSLKNTRLETKDTIAITPAQVDWAVAMPRSLTPAMAEVLANTHMRAEMVPKGVKSLIQPFWKGMRRREDKDTPTETYN